MTLSSLSNQPLTTQEENERQRAYVLTLAIAGILLFLNVSAAVVRGTFDALLIASLVPSAIMVWLAFRARRGAILSSFIILSLVVYLLFAIISAVTSGVGIVQAMLAFAMLFGLASQSLTRHLFPIGTAVAALSTGLIMMDIFWPATRIIIPTTQYNILVGTSLVTGFIFIVLIFQRFNEYNMQVKFVLSVTVLAIVSITITVIFVSITISRSLTNQVGQNLNAVAKARALSIGEYLARELKLLETLSSDRTMQFALQRTNDSYAGLAVSDVRNYLLEQEELWLAATPLERNLLVDVQATLSLRQYVQIFPNNVELVVVDRFGGTIANAGNPDSFYFGGESWFVKAYSSGLGSRYISDPFLLDRERYDPEQQLEVFEGDQPVYGVDIAIPIVFRDPNRTRFEAIGAVKATVILDGILPQLERPQELGQTGEIDFVASDQIIATNGAYSISPEPFSLALLDELQNDTFIISDYQGDASFISHSPLISSQNEAVIGNLRWFVVTHQAQSEALALVTEQQQTQILVGVVIVLVASIAATIVGRLVATPILQLEKTAERFRAGERNVYADITTGDELGRLAVSFNQLTAQVQENEQFLEQRVAERTRALETTSRISRSLSTIIDQQELVLAVVEQIQEAFDYYHVHIYLMSEDGRKLNMAGGTGRVGQQLLSQKHSLPLGVGLVGRAANTNTAVIVPDVTRDHTWKPNPLLPDTKSEIAVPIALGQQVLGVLDVQNREINSLGEQDANLLQAISNQVAVGLRNADLYARAQREAEREQLINEIGQKIQDTTDVESALRVALYELGTALKQAPTAVKLHQTTKSNGHD
ncbi:MAG: GAF domain-containing protein [Chloroflexi bacterium]|nr:GAF domain-containing protein [Chloroflexota bacterium]